MTEREQSDNPLCPTCKDERVVEREQYEVYESTGADVVYLVPCPDCTED